MLNFEGDKIVDQIKDRREHFVPLHTTDVVEFLAQHPSLNQNQQTEFRKLSSLILALLHQLYRQRHEHLTYIYAPLDPDRDRMLMTVPTAPNRDRLVAQLFDNLHDLLDRANFRQLQTDEIKQAIKAASHWGVRMRINFDTLQNLEVYARGYVIGQRSRRDWTNFFRLQTFDVPLYQRIVVMFRTTPELLSTQFDSQRVYLRMFKNVPHQDVDMLLPSTGIQMSWLDHSRIVVPSLYAAATMLWRFLRNVLLLTLFGVFKTVALVLLVLFAIGFGIKSMLTYRTNTQRRYLLNMTQSLYYQNLDNNGGVVLKLLDEGEQQEACEAILAYFATAFCLRDEPHVSLLDIDIACEALLLDATLLHIDFDIENTVRNLSQFGIISADPDVGWRAAPLHEAIKLLDTAWDDWFKT